jgi:hypothetical protein
LYLNADIVVLTPKEASVISQSYNILEFIEEVRDKEYWDIMYSAEKEATEAWRCLYRPKMAAQAKQKGGENYAKLLESFMFYLRYGAKQKRVNHETFVLFRSVREKLLKQV